MDLPAVKAPEGYHYTLCPVMMTGTIDKTKEVIKVLFLWTHTWPAEKSTDVGQTFVKFMQNPLPPYIKMIGPFINIGGDGVKGCIIWDVEKGHEDEGLLFIMKNAVDYFNIGGQKFTLEPVVTGADALPLVGLSL
ncbi:MAG: hypothetical protein ACE5H6_02185 [Dehalococcoidia bacterium]